MSKTFLKGAVVGGLAAVAIGALNSPKKRKELKKKWKKTVDDLTDRGKALQSDVKPFFESIATTAKNTLDEAKKGFKKVRAEGRKSIKYIKSVKPVKSKVRKTR